MTDKELESNKAAFFAMIRQDPTNNDTRLVFADWCEENGLDELAGMLRGGSEKWLSEFAAEFYDEYYPDDDENDERQVRYEFGIDGLLQAAHNYLDTGDDYGLGFQTPDRVFTDRFEFWKHFEVMTGRKPPEDQKGDTFFRCAC